MHTSVKREHSIVEMAVRSATQFSTADAPLNNAGGTLAQQARSSAWGHTERRVTELKFKLRRPSKEKWDVTAEQSCSGARVD